MISAKPIIPINETKQLRLVFFLEFRQNEHLITNQAYTLNRNHAHTNYTLF